MVWLSNDEVYKVWKKTFSKTEALKNFYWCLRTGRGSFHWWNHHNHLAWKTGSVFWEPNSDYLDEDLSNFLTTAFWLCLNFNKLQNVTLVLSTHNPSKDSSTFDPCLARTSHSPLLSATSSLREHLKSPEGKKRGEELLRDKEQVQKGVSWYLQSYMGYVCWISPLLGTYGWVQS